MKSKPFLRVIVFILVFCVFFFITSQVLSIDFGYDSQTTTFYKLPSDSIDVLFIGASGFFRGVSPLTMWVEQGFTAYSRAIPSQQAISAYYYFLESLKYQTPEVVVLDAYRLVNTASFERNDFAFRASYQSMRFSLIKLKSIIDIASGNDLNTTLGYLLPFYRYHHRWRELSLEDWKIFTTNKGDPFKGFDASFEIFPVTLPENFMTPTDAVYGMIISSREYFDKIIEICIEKDIEVLLVSMPRLERADYFEFNAVNQYAKEHELTLIDYNLPEYFDLVGFDPLTDMSDEHHVNAFGAVKFSSHLGEYLKTHFDLDDKRNDPEYVQWHADAEQLAKLIQENREILGITK